MAPHTEFLTVPATLVQDGKRLVIRTPATGLTGRLFQIAGITLLPNVREVAAA